MISVILFRDRSFFQNDERTGTEFTSVSCSLGFPVPEEQSRLKVSATRADHDHGVSPPFSSEYWISSGLILLRIHLSEDDEQNTGRIEP